MKLKDLEKRLKSEPNNLGLRVQVAGMMREAGRSLEAVELYRSVALAYRDQGRTQQAIAVCKSILEIAPEDSGCQGLLGMLQQQALRATPVPVRPSRPSGADLLRRQSQPELRPQNPATPRHASPTAQRGAERSAPSPTGRPAPVAPPAGHAPGTRPGSATMRSSPMPPAPEVPSLRPATNPVTGRPVTNAPATRPTTNPPPVGRSITRDRPLPRPQVLDRDSPVPPRPSRPSEHGSRRSSLDQTPLPPPLPYHAADRTSQPTKLSSRDLQDDNDTRPETNPPGLAGGPRRISHLIADTRGVPNEVDLSAELDTRQRRRIDSEELDKIAQPPPPPQSRPPLEDYELDLDTPPPRSSDDLLTGQRGSLAPTPRGSDDALTPPSRRSSPSLPRIGPPPTRTSSRPPVAIPPKTPSRPSIVSIPPKNDSRPPGGMSGSSPPGKLRPPPGRVVPSRSAMPKIARDSDDEMTQPRDKSPYDDDDDKG